MRFASGARRLPAGLALAAALGATRPAPAAAHEGWGVVVDARGRVYVADIPRNTVWRISRDGGAERVARRVHSHALALGPDGAVYGTHVHATLPRRGVWRLDAAGRLSAVVPATEGTALGLQSFLLAPDGTIYSGSVHQHPAPPGGRELYLLRRSPSGVIDTVAGGLVGHADGYGRSARFQSIDGMAWLPDSSMIVADGPRLRRVTRDGLVETLGAPLSTPRWGEDLLGLTVGPDGAIYAADFAGRTLWRVTAQGRSAVHGPGRLWAPTGAAATEGGELFVLEHPRAPVGILGDLGVGPYLRVHHRSADGRWTVLATRWGDRTAPAAVALAALCAAAALAVRARRRRARR